MKDNSMSKLMHVLLIGALQLCSLFVIGGAEKSPCGHKHMSRKRSPLAYESIIIDREEAGPSTLTISPARLEEDSVESFPRIGFSHKTNHYGVILEHGDIAQRQAAAVINPYTAGCQELTQASLALYQRGGQLFFKQLHAYFNENKQMFDALQREPGNYMLLSVDDFYFGDLAYDHMALMNMPLTLNKQNKSAVLKALCLNLHKIIVEGFYPRFQSNNLAGAMVVLPALGHDPLFNGYKGPVIAKMFLTAIVSTLRYLHELGHSRLKCFSFVVDSKEAYEDYRVAFSDYLKVAGDSFQSI